MAVAQEMPDHRRQPTFHDALTSLLREQARYMSVTELRDQLRTRGHMMGRTTMYRLLEGMVRRGDSDRIVGHRGEARYRWSSANSDLYPLICRRCRRVVEVDGTELERWAHETAAQHGFSDLQLHTMIIGVCPDCLCAEADDSASSA